MKYKTNKTIAQALFVSRISTTSKNLFVLRNVSLRALCVANNPY